jgi:hypothetical protein
MISLRMAATASLAARQVRRRHRIMVIHAMELFPDRKITGIR